MPVFRMNIVLANGKRHNGYHIVDGIELDTYYRHLYRLAQRTGVQIVTFDVVQVSEFSCESTYMRNNNLRRMSHLAPTARPMQSTGRRRRRF